MGEWKTLHIE